MLANVTSGSPILSCSVALFNRVGNAPRVERLSSLFPIHARGVAHAVKRGQPLKIKLADH